MDDPARHTVDYGTELYREPKSLNIYITYQKPIIGTEVRRVTKTAPSYKELQTDEETEKSAIAVINVLRGES